mgnify:FL=1
MTPLQLNAIPLLSGAFFCPFDRSPEMMARLTWPDIAWGLTNTPRFGAQTAMPVTVGAHTLCVLAAARRLVWPDCALRGRDACEADRIVDGEIARAALLHDAAESILGDIPTPFKRHPAYAEVARMEESLQQAINERFGASDDAHRRPAVKDADNFALAVEAWVGHGLDARDWGYAVPDRWGALRDVAHDHIVCILRASGADVFNRLLDAGVDAMLCTEDEAGAAYDRIDAAWTNGDVPWWPKGGAR